MKLRLGNGDSTLDYLGGPSCNHKSLYKREVEGDLTQRRRQCHCRGKDWHERPQPCGHRRPPEAGRGKEQKNSPPEPSKESLLPTSLTSAQWHWLQTPDSNYKKFVFLSSAFCGPLLEPLQGMNFHCQSQRLQDVLGTPAEHQSIFNKQNKQANKQKPCNTTGLYRR